MDDYNSTDVPFYFCWANWVVYGSIHCRFKNSTASTPNFLFNSSFCIDNCVDSQIYFLKNQTLSLLLFKNHLLRSRYGTTSYISTSANNVHVIVCHVSICLPHQKNVHVIYCNVSR